MDGLSIDFIYEGPPDSSELVQILTHLLESDACTTEKDGQSNQCRYFLGWDGSGRIKAEPSTAFEQLGERKAGSAKLFLHGSDGFGPLDFSVQFIDDSIEEFHVDAPDQFIVSIHVDNVYFDPMKRSDDELRAYSERLVALAKTLYEAANPIHVVGYRVLPGVEASLFPVGPQDIGDVRIVRPVDWLTIFEPDTLDRIGRDWLDDVPLWHREQLDAGAELLVLTAHPREDPDIDERLDEIGKRM